jgi:Concanavalin A-like lectin/glucanases superfamily
MARCSAFLMLLFALVPAAAVSQSIPSPFCNAGLHPDGYVDFSKLPQPPTTGGGGSSAPFTVTLPVEGVPGLTVQVTIPPLVFLSRAPLYAVSDGVLVLNGTPAANEEILQFQFSKPIAGVGLQASIFARGESFTLETNSLSPPVPPSSVNTAGSQTLALFHDGNYLQAVQTYYGGGNYLSAGTLKTTGGGYGSPQVSNLRVQTSDATGASSIPKQGLQQWLMSDSANDPQAGSASLWPDQSGNGHDASQPTAANQPNQTLQDGPNCRGAFVFYNNEYFNFNMPIDGWSQMSIFMVAKSFTNPPSGSYASQAAAIFWNENALWGNTFVNPYQSSVPFRFGTTQVNNQPIYTRPVTIGQDFTLTRAVHNGTTDSLYVDGLLALRQQGKSEILNGTSGAGFIGRGLNNTYFNGEISEILVYNRILTADETATVESYLRNKFGTR